MKDDNECVKQSVHAVWSKESSVAELQGCNSHPRSSGFISYKLSLENTCNSFLYNIFISIFSL